MREGEFLGVAVADLHAARIEGPVVRVYTQAGEEHLEHVLLVNHVGREDGAVYEERDVLVFVGEHQVRVVVLLGDAVPEVPKRVLRAPGVAEGCGGVTLDAFRRKFRALFYGDFLERESLEEFLPFFLQGTFFGHVVGCREREGIDAAAVAGNEAACLVGRVITLARDVEECAGCPESLFGIELAEGRLLAAGFQTLHFHLGAVHQVHRFAVVERDLAQHRPAACRRVIEFVGSPVFAADDGPVAAGELETETAVPDGAFGHALLASLCACRRGFAIVVVVLRRGGGGVVALRFRVGQRVAVSGTRRNKEQRKQARTHLCETAVETGHTGKSFRRRNHHESKDTKTICSRPAFFIPGWNMVF